MIPAGIEMMNVFGGTAYVAVQRLAEFRGLDTARFQNLLMKEKAVALPYEDPVSYAVNAAWPIVESLATEEKDRIEMLITCSESGIDFGKSLSTYIHHYLGLNRNCRLFEIKQACYSGTSGFQMGLNFVLSQVSPGAKALIVTTDISRFMAVEGTEALLQDNNGGSSHRPDGSRVLTHDWSYAEPSGGAGAVAMLISERPYIFQADAGANGYYGYEVMDTCRPVPDAEAGDADLSLLSYLDCCESTFLEYQRRVSGADYRRSFHQLAFHTPFGGMVKGAHRTMMRKVARALPAEIDSDFEQRVMPSLTYCQRVGNIMGGTVFLALASTIDNAQIPSPRRVGCFSYGSGCCSEFYSGVITPSGQERLRRREIKRHLDERYELTMDEYHQVLLNSTGVRFGTRNAKLDTAFVPNARALCKGKRRLYLREIKEFHREYEWQA